MSITLTQEEFNDILKNNDRRAKKIDPRKLSLLARVSVRVISDIEKAMAYDRGNIAEKGCGRLGVDHGDSQ